MIEQLLLEDHDPVDVAAAALYLVATGAVGTRRPKVTLDVPQSPPPPPARTERAPVAPAPFERPVRERRAALPQAAEAARPDRPKREWRPASAQRAEAAPTDRPTREPKREWRPADRSPDNQTPQRKPRRPVGFSGPTGKPAGKFGGKFGGKPGPRGSKWATPTSGGRPKRPR
jgi:hypothetical protein